MRHFLSGDALSGTLYMAYIHMITGLSTGEESSQHCFVLLQHNGNFYDAQNPNISWNHIFYAFERYYDSLRMDFMQKQSLAHQSANVSTLMRSSKGISQQELQALILVTKLVKQIAQHSDKSRIALCEFQRGASDLSLNASSMMMAHHGQASSLPILMFGFLSCPIPVNLKGEILHLLAALSLTPQIASNMWQALESSQIIQTIPSAPMKSGIEMELEEIEAKEETYPLLIGFLELINNLIAVKIPENLGIGFREKGKALGFQPYLHFLVHNVYLKFTSRQYKNPSEKWQIGSLILHIFYKLIKSYEINEADFRSNPFEETQTQKSAGYTLMYEFMHDGPMIKMLFSVLTDSINYFCEYNPETDVNVEYCSLYALQLIYHTLLKQKLYIEFMKTSNMNMVNSGIEKLLVQINPKSNKIDNLMCMFRFMQFSAHLVRHCYYALNILLELTEYMGINSQLLNFFMTGCASPREQLDIVNGFVECIDFDDADTINENVDEKVDDSPLYANFKLNEAAEFRALARLKTLKLILINLKYVAPNLAHLLLGFDVRKPLHKAQFFLPGTNLTGTASSIVARNCLHSVINTLNGILKENSLIHTQSFTNEYCYEILYNLCSNVACSNEILNFLRNEYDFISSHLKEVPFQVAAAVVESDKEMADDASVVTENFSMIDQYSVEKKRSKQTFNRSFYSSNAWIVYLACIELQNLLANRMRTQATKLVQLLIEATSENTHDDSLAFLSVLQNQSHANNTNLFFSMMNTTSGGLFQKQDARKSDRQSENMNNKIFKLLAVVELTDEPVEMLALNYFDVKLTEKVMDSCRYRSDLVGVGAGVQLYDVKQIQTILMNEISADANVVSLRQNIISEIKMILNNIVERNQFQLKFVAKKKYLDSFRTLVETLFLLTPNEILNITVRYKLLISLIKELLEMVFVEDVIVELTYPIAGLLFTLMCNLKMVIDESVRQEMSNAGDMFAGQQHQTPVLQLYNPSHLYDLLSKAIEYLLNSCNCLRNDFFWILFYWIYFIF